MSASLSVLMIEKSPHAATSKFPDLSREHHHALQRARQARRTATLVASGEYRLVEQVVSDHTALRRLSIQMQHPDVVTMLAYPNAWRPMGVLKNGSRSWFWKPCSMRNDEAMPFSMHLAVNARRHQEGKIAPGKQREAGKPTGSRHIDPQQIV